WPNSKESCGREIQTARLGWKRAWFMQGDAYQKFEQDLDPELGEILRHVDCQDAEVTIRVYMIGRSEDACRPTIMVCCVNASVRREAKKSLRNSFILKENPGFSLGSIDYPLEQLVPARRLASEASQTTVGSKPDTRLEVCATSDLANIGRLLFISDCRFDRGYTCATGGVVLRVDQNFYQLTVGHITTGPNHTQEVPSRIDPDACSFDGESESGNESDDFSVLERTMRKASMSFQSSPHVRIGMVARRSQDGSNPNLDYALVSIKRPSIPTRLNEVSLSPGLESSSLQVRQISAVGHEEKQIIAVTGSSGVLKGVLIPGATFLVTSDQRKPQKLYVVQLNGVLTDGDSGTAIVDETSGDLYGHIISGCPGTRIGYITPATEIFEDL
ncbi:hypothetical protein EDB81DRAFT_606522, partial [Dactylonectria macrodidyma]